MTHLPKALRGETYQAILGGMTIRSLSLRAALPPLPQPLSTASGRLTHAPVVLLDLTTSTGVVGHSYLFSPRADMLRPLMAVCAALGEIVKDRPCDPLAVSFALDQAFLLFGGTGLVTMARAGIDMALWDALAKEQGQPLYRLLGGDDAPVQAYESSGLGLSSPQAVADEAARYLANGFGQMKLRLGYDTLDKDVQAVATVRAVIGNAGLMVDYNQALGYDNALERCRALDDFDLLWIEEPLHAADLEQSANLAKSIKTPLQIGENLFTQFEVKRAIALKASRYLMPDVVKIGGVTQWLMAAHAAEGAGVPVSSHLFPEISAHLLASVPNRHFLEYANWVDAVLAAPTSPVNGMVQPSQAPGTGIAWNEDAVARYGLAL
jgi:mandelate racemase